MDMPENFLDALHRLLSNVQIESNAQATDLLQQFFEELGWQLDENAIAEFAEHLIDPDSDYDPSSFEAYWGRLQSQAQVRGISHLVQNPEDFKGMHELNVDPDDIVDQLILRVFTEDPVGSTTD